MAKLSKIWHKDDDDDADDDDEGDADDDDEKRLMTPREKDNDHDENVWWHLDRRMTIMMKVSDDTEVPRKKDDDHDEGVEGLLANHPVDHFPHTRNI